MLKFCVDQTGVGLDYRGLHHIGILVEGDLDAWTKRVESLGAPNIPRPEESPPGINVELKFRGPDGVVFDIERRPWPGSAALPE